MSRRTFWLGAAAVAIVTAAALAVIFPYGALGIESAAERRQAWHLTLWTSGVLAICFGSAGLLNSFSAIGIRDVVEYGSVIDAVEAKRSSRDSNESNFYNFAGWLVTTGFMLVGIYFMAWLSSGA
jgi:hypothetical protein